MFVHVENKLLQSVLYMYVQSYSQIECNFSHDINSWNQTNLGRFYFDLIWPCSSSTYVSIFWTYRELQKAQEFEDDLETLTRDVRKNEGHSVKATMWKSIVMLLEFYSLTEAHGLFMSTHISNEIGRSHVFWDSL